MSPMRDERRSPRISIGDGLLLIAATGIGLGAVRYVVINMLRGQTSLLDIFSSPRGGWTTFDVLRRAQDLLVALLPFVGDSKIVLPGLRLIQQRFSREHLFLQSGMTACGSAM